MEELLVVVFQFLIEVGLQLIGGTALDYAGRRRQREQNTLGCIQGCGWPGVFIALGGICGGFSVFIAPQPLLPFAWLRITNLIVAPLIAGALSHSAALHLWDESRPTAREHFWHGFAFAMAYGIVRFAYLHR